MNIELLVEDFCYQSLHLRNVSPTTIKRYKEKVGAFYRRTNISSIEEVTKPLVLRYFLEGRADRNWKVATFRTYYMTLLVFFRWCVEQGYLESNPVEGMELPSPDVSLPKALKRQDALKLLEIIYNYPYTQKFLKYRNHAIFATFIFSGLRKSELLNLKLTDVDIENRSIFVYQGKGNKDRIIPMSYTLAQSLNRYLVERKKARKTCPEFFTSSNRNNGFTEYGLKHFTDTLKKTIPISFTIHGLRHTFATLMIEGGCDVVSLSKMMGHSDVRTTMIYVATSVEHLRSKMLKHPLNS